MYTETQKNEEIKGFVATAKDIIDNFENLDLAQISIKLNDLKTEIQDYSDDVGGNDARFVKLLANIEALEKKIEDELNSVF